MRSLLIPTLCISKLVVVILCLARNHAFALPATPPSLDVDSGGTYQPSNSTLSELISSRPDGAACNETLGFLDFDDCNKAIKLLPHDPRGKPVGRNFYANPRDISTDMPNQQVPFEKTYAGCTVQILLATNFVNVPQDQSSWINLIGPARILMRECARDQGIGGVITRNGQNENLEVVLYNQRSVYGKVHIIRYSHDAVAISIATQELLELLHLAPNIYDEGPELQSVIQMIGKNGTSIEPNASMATV